MGVLEYHSNNSGGDWWLKDEDWRALEAAGWVVHWVHDADDSSHVHEATHRFRTTHTHHYDDKHRLTKVSPNGNRWLGALASSAAIETDDPEATIKQWEEITGQNSTAEGCNFCGEPHNFYYTDNNGNKHYSSVEVVSTRRTWRRTWR